MPVAILLTRNKRPKSSRLTVHLHLGYTSSTTCMRRLASHDNVCAWPTVNPVCPSVVGQLPQRILGRRLAYQRFRRHSVDLRPLAFLCSAVRIHSCTRKPTLILSANGSRRPDRTQHNYGQIAEISPLHRIIDRRHHVGLEGISLKASDLHKRLMLLRWALDTYVSLNIVRFRLGRVIAGNSAVWVDINTDKRHSKRIHDFRARSWLICEIADRQAKTFSTFPGVGFHSLILVVSRQQA